MRAHQDAARPRRAHRPAAARREPAAPAHPWPVLPASAAAAMRRGHRGKQAVGTHAPTREFGRGGPRNESRDCYVADNRTERTLSRPFEHRATRRPAPSNMRRGPYRAAYTRGPQERDAGLRPRSSAVAIVGTIARHDLEAPSPCSERTRPAEHRWGSRATQAERRKAKTTTCFPPAPPASRPRSVRRRRPRTPATDPRDSLDQTAGTDRMIGSTDTQRHDSHRRGTQRARHPSGVR